VVGLRGHIIHQRVEVLLGARQFHPIWVRPGAVERALRLPVNDQFVQQKLIGRPRNHRANFTTDGADVGDCRQIIIRPLPPIDHSGFPAIWTFPVDSRWDLDETHSQKTGAGPPAGTPAAWESGCVKASSSVSGCGSCEVTQVVSQS
jgi:hypothetical protein